MADTNMQLLDTRETDEMNSYQTHLLYITSTRVKGNLLNTTFSVIENILEVWHSS